MRPRQVCRGKSGPIWEATRQTTASMRPRQVCRGKEEEVETRMMEGGGFNEAPASLPGKDVAHHQAICRPCASMRPRQVCRGKPPRRLATGPAKGRFNEAPASLPGKGLRPGRAPGRLDPLQ